MMRPCRLNRWWMLFLGGVVVAGLAADWPRFRGPNGTGIAPDKNVPVTWNERDGILWKVSLPGEGHSCPIVWGDRLFVQTASADGKERSLVCLDVHDGKQLWSQAVPGKRAHTHPKNSLATSTPATDGERVYALFWDGQDVSLYGYTVEGKFLWSRDLGSFSSQHGAGASPIVYQDRVILANDQDGSSRLVALDAKTGKPAWETPRQAFRACYSTPFLLDRPEGTELIVASTAGITGYEPSTGAENWHWHWAFTGMALRTVASPIATEGMVVASAGDGSGARDTVAVKLGSKGADTKDNLVWEKKRDMPYVPGMLALDEYLYFVTDAGFATCCEASTGNRVWSERLGSSVTASPILVDGKVYVCGDDGEVYVFAAAPTFKLLAKNSVGEAVTATPAVADNRLFIRGKSHLFCIGATR